MFRNKVFKVFLVIFVWKDVGAVRLNYKLRRDIKIFFIIFILSSFFFSNLVNADEDTESIVVATFSIEFLTGTDIVVDVTMNADKLTTDRPYNASQIAGASDEEMGALKYSLYLLLKNQINQIFKYAEITNFEMPVYDSGFFNEVFNVKLTSSFFDLNKSINTVNLINGVLDMGAVVTYDFNLVTEPGWNNTFTYILPNHISFKSANTDDVSVNKKEITWTLKWNSLIKEKNAILSIRLRNPTTSVSKEEDIFLRFNLISSNVDNVTLSTDIKFRNIKIQDYAFLPDFITELDYVPSDGIRLFIDNDLISWNDFYGKSVKILIQKTVSTIESSSFNQKLKMLFKWDPETSTNCTNPYNITNMDDNPAIEAKIMSESTIKLLFCNISSRAFFGLVNAGAAANISSEDINFGDRLDQIGQPYEVMLYMPPNIYLQGDNIFRWNDSISPSGLFTSDVQPLPKYSKEIIETHIEVELNKIDLNIPSLFTGKTEFTATTHSKEDFISYITKFPSEFNLSEKIGLPFLNSDAFRICVEESVFTESEIDVFLTNKKIVFENHLSNVLNGLKIKGVVDKDSFLNSLKWDKDFSNMNHLSPIITSNYANNIYPIGFDFSFWPPEIHISNQTYIFTGLENKSVTYRVIFPKGILVTATDSLNKSIIKGKINGREYIEISFTSDEYDKIDTVTCSIVASSIYLLGQFLPCIISFVLVIVLLILLYIFRKKRKGKSRFVRDDSAATEYEGEDFYVPPPPSSKK